jgi:hypothetical protein
LRTAIKLGEALFWHGDDTHSGVDTHVPVRTEVQLVTGLAVYLTPGPVEWAIDRDPAAIAASWWKSHGSDYEPGKLYRYGVLYEPAWAYSRP